MAQGDITRFAQEIKAFADVVQLLDNAAIDVYNKRSVGTAFGQTLDYVGSQVGCSRPANMVGDDDSYRALIRATIQMNYSGGEPERLIAAMEILTSAVAATVNYQDYYLMASLEFVGTVIVNLWNLIKRIVAGGVNLRLVQKSPTTPFLFDSSTNGLDNGQLGNLVSQQ